MSFREKNAWIAVVTTLIVWGYYFFAVWQAVEARALDGQAILNLFLVCMAITLVVLMGVNLLAARLARQEFGAPEDERERAVDDRGNRFGARLLEWLLVGFAILLPTVIAGMVRDGFAGDPAEAMALISTNGILFCLVVSQVVREMINIVNFRMMA